MPLINGQAWVKRQINKAQWKIRKGTGVAYVITYHAILIRVRGEPQIVSLKPGRALFGIIQWTRRLINDTFFGKSTQPFCMIFDSKQANKLLNMKMVSVSY